MAEVTYTGKSDFNLPRGKGGGAKLLAMEVQGDDGETILTALSRVLCCLSGKIGAPADADVWFETISTGSVTLGTGKLTSPSTSVASQNWYIAIIGFRR